MTTKHKCSFNLDFDTGLVLKMSQRVFLLTGFPFCSEFADIFDLEHFKSVLADDVRVVSSLPSTHLMTRPVEGSPPPHATPSWIRSHYLRRVSLFYLHI